MRIWKSQQLALVFGLWTFLPGCATRETIPKVRVVEESGGIRLGASRRHGPESLLGALNERPDVPSGVSLRLQRMHPLHNEEPRYFIPASGELQVVSVEDATRYNTKDDDFVKRVRQWEAWISAGQFASDSAPYRQLSEIPWTNAVRVFHAKLRRRSYLWGKAILFLTTYVQGNTGSPVNNDMLVLVVQGLTNDGRYAVNGHFEIRHPRLPGSTWDKHDVEKEYFKIADEFKSRRAEKWLNAQPDSSFEPALQEYDEFLAKLEITPPERR